MFDQQVRPHRSRNLIALAVLALPAPALAVDANWLGDNGTWTNPARWSTNPFFPDNGNGGQTYDVFLAAAGAHTITLNTNVTINSLSLNSASATLLHSAGTFTSLGTFALQSGTYRLNGGTIRGATINRTGGALAVGGSGGTLTDNASVIGDVTLSETNARLLFRTNAGFTGSATFAGGGNQLSYLYNVTIGSGRTINMNGTTGRLDVSSPDGSTSSTLTLASGALVRGSGSLTSDAHGAAAANTIVNNGRITGDVAGARLDISPDVFVNNGTVTLDTGTLSIGAGSWSSSAGRFVVNGGSLILGSSFTTADMNIPQFSRAGGTVTIAGSLNNNGATLALAPNTGPLRLSGTISGGTITQSGVNTLSPASQTGTLTGGATLVGHLTIDEASGDLVLAAGSDFTGNANLNATNAQLGYLYSATLGSGRTVTFNSTGGRLDVSGTGTLANTLTIASGATVRSLNRGTVSSDTFGAAVGNRVINNGLMIADADTAVLGIEPDVFTNNGTASVTAGTLAINAASWSSAGGRLAVSGGTLALGGNFTTAGLNLAQLLRSGGTINLTGALDNGGATLALNDTTGPIRHLGLINGGTITQSGTGQLQYASGGGTISNNATMVGNLTMDTTGGRVLFRTGSDFTGSATLSGNNSVLSFGYGKTLAAGQTVNLNATGARLDVSGEGTDPNTLTIAAGATVRGRGFISSDNFVSAAGNRVVNRGLISADIGTATFSIEPDLFTNEGTLAATGAGRLIVTTPLTGGTGTLSSDGPGSALRVLSGTYNVDRLMRTSNRGVINLQGQPTKAANFDVGGIVIFNYSGASPLPQFRADLISGYAGGAWNGPGIFSTAASQGANAGFTGVGFAEAGELFTTFPATYAGESGIDNTTLLLRFTRYGDANLDGTVNLVDFNRLAANFGTGDTWIEGDFNYDGIVNLGDFNRLAINFGITAAGPGVTPQDWANLAAAVPEPTGVTTSASTMLGLLAARRVRRRAVAC